MNIDVSPLTLKALRAIAAGVAFWGVAVVAFRFGVALAWVLLMLGAAMAGIKGMIAAMKAGTWPAMILFVLGVPLTLLSAVGFFAIFGPM